MLREGGNILLEMTYPNRLKSLRMYQPIIDIHLTAEGGGKARRCVGRRFVFASAIFQINDPPCDYSNGSPNLARPFTFFFTLCLTVNK
jgi:hypothetical protein